MIVLFYTSFFVKLLKSQSILQRCKLIRVPVGYIFINFAQIKKKSLDIYCSVFNYLIINKIK